MQTHRIVKALIILIAVWLIIGVISLHVFHAGRPRSIPLGPDTGWVPFSITGTEQNYSFEIIDPQPSLITKGTTLKVIVDNVDLKQNYYNPLWWIPLFYKPRTLGSLSSGGCVSVIDMHQVAGKWTWLLVKKIACPALPSELKGHDSESELEQFLKNTMKNIYQFKEDVKEYIDEIERTAEELEEYERQLEKSSKEKNSDAL